MTSQAQPPPQKLILQPRIVVTTQMADFPPRVPIKPSLCSRLRFRVFDHYINAAGYKQVERTPSGRTSAGSVATPHLRVPSLPSLHRYRGTNQQIHTSTDQRRPSSEVQACMPNAHAMSQCWWWTSMGLCTLW